MKAGAIEFRLRMWIQIVIVFLGFWAPWLGPLDWSGRISTLAWLAMEISRLGIASFSVATPVVIVAGALAALVGAVLRVWGAAYLGYSTVHHEDMQGSAVMAAGPFQAKAVPQLKGKAKSITIPTHEFAGPNGAPWIEERIDFPASWDVHVMEMAGHNMPVLTPQQIA